MQLNLETPYKSPRNGRQPQQSSPQTSQRRVPGPASKPPHAHRRPSHAHDTPLHTSTGRPPLAPGGTGARPRWNNPPVWPDLGNDPASAPPALAQEARKAVTWTLRLTWPGVGGVVVKWLCIVIIFFSLILLSLLSKPYSLVLLSKPCSLNPLITHL